MRGTLKITSAMKLVASSKLRKAQKAIEALRPYEEALASMLASASSGGVMAGGVWGQRAINLGQRPFDPKPRRPEETVESGETDEKQGKVVVVAFSSNSSMCGAFNANVIKRTLGEIRAIRASGRQVEAWAFGKKVAEALRKAGIPAARDYTALVSRAEYSAVAEIAEGLRGLGASGEVDSVLLVYNHFVSTGRQEIVVPRNSLTFRELRNLPARKKMQAKVVRC